MNEQGVLSFKMKDIDGETRELNEYRGRVLLIANVASKCGFTPQYGPLEEVYRAYKDRGLSVLAFPANNFGKQEPGTDGEIKTFCETRFGITFDLYSKISVAGDDIHPLFKYLTSRPGFDWPVGWNFEKFLVDRKGNLVARFPSKTEPSSAELTTKIEELLSAE